MGKILLFLMIVFLLSLEEIISFSKRRISSWREEKKIKKQEYYRALGKKIEKKFGLKHVQVLKENYKGEIICKGLENVGGAFVENFFIFNKKELE